MILPALIEEWKEAHKPSLGISQHVVPGPEPSGDNDLSPVIDGIGITKREAMLILIKIFSSDSNLTVSFIVN